MSNLLKGLGFAGAGAYGYQQVQQNEMFSAWSRMLGGLDGNANRAASSAGASTSGGGGEQMKVLQGEVDRLHQLLSDVVRGQKQGFTVVHTGRNSWAVYVYPVIGVGLVYAYCRITGTSIWDLFYVSQSSMSNFKATVAEGFARIWEEVRKQKDELLTKFNVFGQKQEQLMQSQALLDERLQQVGDSVDAVKVNTHNINSRVNKIDNKVSDVLDGMANVQSGIMLLCQTVSEVTHRIGMNNTRSSQALKGFLSGGSQTGFAAGATHLSGGHIPLPLASGPSASGGSALGLNSLLEGSASDSSPGAAAVYELPAGVGIISEVAPSAGSKTEQSIRSSGGPPSFPKAPKPASAGSLPFWGLSRGMSSTTL